MMPKSKSVQDIQALLNRDHGFNLKLDGDFGSSTFWDDSKTVDAILQTLVKIGGPLEEPADPEPAALSSDRSVYIEIGHGNKPEGYDPGAVRVGTNVNEHYLNGVVAMAMQARLNALGIRCEIGDPKVSNYSSGKAAKGHDVLISIHHNSHTDGSSAQGAEALYDPRTKNPKSDARLARFISAAMADANSIADRGAKSRRLSVLSGGRAVGVPYSSLIECYFVQRRPDDNPATAEMDAWSQNAGLAAANAIAKFLGTV